MAADRNRQLMLLALVVVLGAIAYRVWPGTSVAPASASNEKAPRAARGPASAASTGAVTAAPDVHLEALDGKRPKPIDAERDLFRFKPKVVAPPRVAPRPADAVPVATGPPPPPPLAPIALKFIGVVQQGTDKPVIAILSDGRHAPFYGREGDIIEGRYKVLRIGVESIDMAYLDGRGRQTIRLTGS